MVWFDFGCSIQLSTVQFSTRSCLEEEKSSQHEYCSEDNGVACKLLNQMLQLKHTYRNVNRDPCTVWAQALVLALIRFCSRDSCIKIHAAHTTTHSPNINSELRLFTTRERTINDQKRMNTKILRLITQKNNNNIFK